MPPHSLLRACSKCTTLLCSEPCHLTVSSSLFGWCALRHSEPCHLTVSSSLFGWCALRHSEPCHLTVSSSLFGWGALRHSEPCHLTVSYEPVRLVCPAAFRAMPPHSLLRACSVRRIRRIAQYKKCLVHASMTSHFLYCAAWL